MSSEGTTATVYLLHDIENRKLTRERNVVFDKNKVIGFRNETRDIEDNLISAVSCDQKNLDVENQIIVKAEVKEENSPETLA